MVRFGRRPAAWSGWRTNERGGAGIRPEFGGAARRLVRLADQGRTTETRNESSAIFGPRPLPTSGARPSQPLRSRKPSRGIVGR